PQAYPAIWLYFAALRTSDDPPDLDRIEVVAPSHDFKSEIPGAPEGRRKALGFGRTHKGYGGSDAARAWRFTRMRTSRRCLGGRSAPPSAPGNAPAGGACRARRVLRSAGRGSGATIGDRCRRWSTIPASGIASGD